MKLLIKEQFNKFTNTEGYRIITAIVLEVLEGEYNNKTITVVGNIPSLYKNEQLLIEGHIEKHSKYGSNFKVTSYEKPIPKNKEQIIAFLSSSMFKGIGKKIAEVIYNELGNRTIEKIGKQGISSLENIKLSEEKKNVIVQVIQENYLLTDTISFYSKYGINADKVVKLYQLTKKADDIMQNPYLFTQYGLTDFHSVDHIALENNILPHNTKRLEAAFSFLIKDDVKKGHCFIEEDTFINKTLKYLNSRVTPQNYIFHTTICNALYESKVCMAELGLIYPTALYYAELQLAKHVAKRINIQTYPYSYLETELAIQSLNTKATDEQSNAVHQFIQNDIFVLTGEAGSGKTFTIDLMLQTALKLNKDLKIALTAPTGRAAKRIVESLSIEGTASTLHRLLGYGRDGRSNVPYYNEENPLDYDIIIADEFSMTDVTLAKNLLCAMKDGSKLCICGDVNQLESIGAGSVLKDLLDTTIPTVHLTKGFRQANNSKIRKSSIAIKNGEMIDLTNDSSQYFIECNIMQIPNFIVASVRKLLKKGVSINEIMVLSPMKAGINGVNYLNKVIKEVVNPLMSSKKEISLGEFSFREGDKVMCLINDTETNVYNGDIGYVSNINLIDNELTIDFEGNLVTVPRKDMMDYTLAYATSIHKAQGNEADFVISVYSNEHLVMLKRNLCYTGLTRAKVTNILIGQVSALKHSIQNYDLTPRRTNLAKLINRKIRNLPTKDKFIS